MILLVLAAVAAAVWWWERRDALVGARRVVVALSPPLLALVVVLVARGDLVVQKLLGHLVMPTGLLFLGLFAASVRASLAGRHASWGLTLAFVLAGNAQLASALAGTLEDDVPPYDLASDPPFDAVLVLGGGTKPGPTGPELNSHGDRVALAARLYHAKKTPLLVASGHGIAGISRQNLADETHAIWRQLGVPDEAIVRLPDPRNTKEEIAAYARFLAERRAAGAALARVGVVSSAWHLPRVLALAGRAGLELVPIPADHASGRIELSSLWFIPTGSGFQGIYQVCWELVGRAIGR